MTDIEYLERYVEPFKLDEAINRLNNGEPVQYIVGHVDFYGYRINVNKNVLIPRFETEELVENTIKYINKFFNKNINVLEIGTGSGCISIALMKELNNINVVATDISKEALQVAQENAKNNNVEIEFINTNIFDNVSKKIDVIVSNPPYISKQEEIMDIVYKNEPHLALFADDNGLYFYKEILKNAKNILNEKYLIAFEIGASQAEVIRQIAKQYLKDAKIIVKKDLQNRDRMIFIHNFE